MLLPHPQQATTVIGALTSNARKRSSKVACSGGGGWRRVRLMLPQACLVINQSNITAFSTSLPSALSHAPACSLPSSQQHNTVAAGVPCCPWVTSIEEGGCQSQGGCRIDHKQNVYRLTTPRIPSSIMHPRSPSTPKLPCRIVLHAHEHQPALRPDSRSSLWPHHRCSVAHSRGGYQQPGEGM